MRYAFTLAGRTHHVTQEEHADGPRYKVGGSVLVPSVRSLGDGLFEVDVDGETFHFTVENGRIHDTDGLLDLEIARARPELVRAGGRGRAADGRIKPPMPGKVVEIPVREGQTVGEGEVLLVLEAMKMQNDLKSPIAGTVTKVNVSVGQNVEATTVLLEVTPEPAA